MAKKITMQTIADRLGISKFSVSQALSGKEGISEETRQRVLETAKAFGYSKRGYADKPVPVVMDEQLNKTFVLVWVPMINREERLFWDHVVVGILNGCKEMGWDYLVASPPNEAQLDKVFPPYVDQEACVGMILVGTFPSTFILSLQKVGLPLVLVDHEEPLANVDCVVNANIDASKTITNRLLSTGCRSILFVGDVGFSVSFRERWWGCRMAAEEYAMNDQTVSLQQWNLPYGGTGWSELLTKKLSTILTDLPDGFICANDHIAIELLRNLTEFQIDVPSTCKVIGFDNIETSAYSTPPLTTTDLSKEDLGYRAVEVLKRRALRPGAKVEKVILSARIVIRCTG